MNILRMAQSGIMATLFASALAAGPAQSQDAGALVPKVSYGNYVRVEAGMTRFNGGDASWLPSGYPDDPKVYFDISGEEPSSGTLAFGFDWSNGRRADLSITSVQSQPFDAPWSYTVPADDKEHANVSGNVSTTAIMFNYFYSPTPGTVSGPRFSPFVTAGVGIARNTMSDWTRTNDEATQPVRMFEGDTTSGLAWNVGAGFSYDITGRKGRPVYLDFTYRYSDFGKAQGGSTPLPGYGFSEPTRPFNFQNRSQSISIGIRVPLQRL